jgi:hypothetical protein
MITPDLIELVQRVFPDASSLTSLLLRNGRDCTKSIMVKIPHRRVKSRALAWNLLTYLSTIFSACLREDIKDLVMAMKAVSLMHFIQRHGGGNFLSKEKKEKQFQA